MIVHDVRQRSEEWHALRLGKVTSSCAADMLAIKIPPEFTPTGKPSKAKAEELAGRRNLRVRLVLENLTQKSHERDFQSQAMLEGIEREQAAVEAYEAASGRLLRSVGFVSHPTLKAGYSPDGVIGDFEGLIEAKCPLPATHLDYLETGRVPGEYFKQILHGLFITGAQWCDFVSFHPDFPEPGQLKIVRVHRDEALIGDYEKKLRAFLEEVDAKTASLRTMLNLRETLEAAVGAA